MLVKILENRCEVLTSSKIRQRNCHSIAGFALFAEGDSLDMAALQLELKRFYLSEFSL